MKKIVIVMKEKEARARLGSEVRATQNAFPLPAPSFDIANADGEQPAEERQQLKGKARRASKVKGGPGSDRHSFVGVLGHVCEADKHGVQGKFAYVAFVGVNQARAGRGRGVEAGAAEAGAAEAKAAEIARLSTPLLGQSPGQCSPRGWPPTAQRPSPRAVDLCNQVKGSAPLHAAHSRDHRTQGKRLDG